MQENHPIHSIIDRWPSRRELAADLGIDHVVVIHRWHKRERIPAKYDTRLLEAASRRNIPLNWRELMEARAASVDQHGHDNGNCQAIVSEIAPNRGAA